MRPAAFPGSSPRRARARGRPGPAPGPEPRPHPGARRRPRAAAGLTPAFHRRRRGRGGGARRGRGRALVAPATAALIRAWGSRAPPGAVGRRKGGAGHAADPPPRGRAALTPARPVRGIWELLAAPGSRAPRDICTGHAPAAHARAPHCSARLPAGAAPSSPKSPRPAPPRLASRYAPVNTWCPESGGGGLRREVKGSPSLLSGCKGGSGWAAVAPPAGRRASPGLLSRVPLHFLSFFFFFFTERAWLGDPAEPQMSPLTPPTPGAFQLPPRPCPLQFYWSKHLLSTLCMQGPPGHAFIKLSSHLRPRWD